MTSRIATRLLALAMAALCVLGCAAAAPPAALASAVEDGTICVLLTQLGTGLTELDIVLDGSYSVDGNSGFRFERGSRLHVFVSEGEPVLTYEGMTLHTGSGFTLARHQTSGVNGLRLNGGSALYEGDLTVTVLDGALRLVLAIYVEDYVKGVVPYEMNDAFPAEALKAQAVAARTYALKRQNSSRDFDVYDNTNDQVYKGYSAQYATANAAVEATRGLVGTYKGELVECFYSASNGGQTDLYANAFGEDDPAYDYLDMRADPYDLANPQSRVKTASVPKQPTANAAIPQALDALLKTALSEQLAAMGYDDAPESITIIDVLSITPHTPKYDVPSRVFTKLGFRLRLMAREVLPAESDSADGADVTLAEPRVLGDTFTVDLDIFDDVEDALGLSINRTDGELISVRDDGAKYVIESRRFGHGLGMSQRGAEWMAGEYGWTFRQILEFYYPGMEFRVRRYAPSIRPGIAAEAVATPRPTAEPTPRPTYIPVGELPEGAFYVEVALANADSTLNLRAEPNTTSQVLYMLMNGQPLIVLEELGDGWVKVQTGSYVGYVAAQYLRMI